MSLFSDFIDLIYPNCCVACNSTLLNNENCICTLCKYKLPKTDFCKEPDNPVFKMFYGRAEIKAAMAYYFFKKGSRVQHLVHHFKYKGRKDIGLEIGKIIGAELKSSVFFKNIDTIIPVPLHPAKIRKRGYNQASVLAEGISTGYSGNADKSMVNNNILLRVSNISQIQKGRFARWLNASEAFSINPSMISRNNNILLVDDVVTTGSTLDACANILLQLPGISIRIATMAYVGNF